ncbi:hypothetical protein OU798_23490 [Prolixibacteraceae bacterium Z1-6]|uniref:V-type ATP synthase subunit I n=1 Tax=Draconibacterium aestuarii TaxID=2998507 RepID=A0A9X3FA40_9BACT|nr:hypothetical protein [Prolixibacteraceae bacterium Z1-6]
MKKLILFLPDAEEDVDADLTLLGQLGVVHVAPFQPAKHESIERVDARIKQLQEAISILSRYDKTPVPDPVPIDYSVYIENERGAIEMMEKVLDSEHSRIYFEDKKQEHIRAVQWYNTWGTISLADVDELREKGVSIRLYKLDEKEYKLVSKREDIQLVGKDETTYRIALVSSDENEKLPFLEVEIPVEQYDELTDLIAITDEELDHIEGLMAALNTQKNLLEDALQERIRRFDVRNVQFGGISIDNQVRFWKGFLPVDAVDQFVETAEEHHWGYVIEEPLEEEMDEVPTLVRTSKWAERITPVMNFMGLVPGYREMDVSRVFMIFFTFFTGILVGDAGYGLVFLLVTLLVHRKQKFIKKVDFALMYTLSSSIMIWGILTGTYFGAEAIADIPVLRELKVTQLASFGGDTVFIQKLMFLIGAIHLTIGHLQTAWKFHYSVKAIAQLGWVSIIWGLYFVVSQMVLSIPAPAIMMWLFIGGAVLVAFFSKPGTSFFKGLLSSLGDLPLSIINGFSDIISYIRLYAVGLSTVLMASSFNQMAIGDGVTTLASGIGAVIILVLGHGLNMILAAMAVIVHGVRLNMLEYAGHADVEFSGNKYNPFKIKKQNLKK